MNLPLRRKQESPIRDETVLDQYGPRSTGERLEPDRARACTSSPEATDPLGLRGGADREVLGDRFSALFPMISRDMATDLEGGFNSFFYYAADSETFDETYEGSLSLPAQAPLGAISIQVG